MKCVRTYYILWLNSRKKSCNNPLRRGVNDAMIWRYSICAVLGLLSGFGQIAPTGPEQAALIDRVRLQALAYVENLPNFICTQETHRSSATAKAPEQWKTLDTLKIRLTYFGKKEDYRVISVNVKPADKSFTEMKGWKTQGDFGSTLLALFREKTKARFEWQEWTVWDGRKAAVLKFQVDQEHSPFQSSSGPGRKINWAAEGLVFADLETRQVLRLTINSKDIPESFPAREVHIDSQFAFQKIGENEFLLPARSVSMTVTGKERRKSDSRFLDYRKFSADAEIKFGEIAK